MQKKAIFSILITSAVAFGQVSVGNQPVTTGQYTVGRTSANANEAILNPLNVKSSANQFGKLFSWSVDGQIFAQPLYIPGVIVGGKKTDVVFVASMHNSLYAFDAAGTGLTPLWKTSLGLPVPAPTANGCPSQQFTGPELGVLSTPTIDQSTSTIYAVSASPSGGGYVHSIHALDLATGQEKFGGPTAIRASVPGAGYNNQNGTVSLGTSSTEVQRTALLLANGKVYAGFGNCGPDNDPWHGWVIGYSAANLQSQPVLFNSTPNGGQGGIWQSGRGLVVDGSGDIYFTTGNSTPNSFGTVTTGSSSGDANQQNYPMRLVQLSSAGQFQASYPPPNYTALNTYDLDFSSSGPLLIPGTNLLIAGGKDGVIYVFNTTSFGTPVQSFQATGGSPCNIGSDACAQIHDLAFWNNNLYVWGSFDVLRQYSFVNGKFNPTPSSQNQIKFSYRPAALAVSANGTQSGILWATTPDSVLHAFDAANIATELWNSTGNPARDAVPSYARFVQPTVANGRVYVATASNQLAVYGLLTDFSLSSSTASQSLYQGTSASFNVTVTPVSGSNSPVTLSVSGLPRGTTASFNPSTIAGSGSSTVTINAGASTPAGTSNLIISGAGASDTRSTSVALVITTPDSTPPQATCCTYTTSGSSYVMHFTGQDTQSGLQSIIPVQVTNATASVPQFPAGTTGMINFTATESGWSSYVKFKLTDVAGNVTYIDPMCFDPTRQPGAPVPFPVKDVTKDVGVVTIQNGSPGIKNIRIQVNNGLNLSHFEVAGLKDGEIRVIDLRASLPDSSGPTVEITPLGKPGGHALIIFGPNEILPN